MKVKVEFGYIRFEVFPDSPNIEIISVEQQPKGTVLVLYKERNVAEPQVKQWDDVMSVTVDW